MLAAREIGEVHAGAGDHQVVAVAVVALVGDADVVFIGAGDSRVDVVGSGFGDAHGFGGEEVAATVLQAAFELGAQFIGERHEANILL